MYALFRDIVTSIDATKTYIYWITNSPKFASRLRVKRYRTASIIPEETS